MFFILSKILQFLTSPLFWIVLCFVLSLTIKRKSRRKRLRIAGIVMLLVFTNPLITNFIVEWWEEEPVALSDIQEHDIAVVFSGVTNGFVEPQDRVYFQKGADRITHALHLYRLGKVKKILVTGGNGNVIGSSVIEGKNLAKFLEMTGVPKEDIIKETSARNSYENAVFTKKLMNKSYPDAKLILVTSAFHMPRSYGCAQKVGLKVTPFPCDFYTQRGKYGFDTIIIPDPKALDHWRMLIHEWVGYIVYWLTGKV